LIYLFYNKTKSTGTKQPTSIPKTCLKDRQTKWQTKRRIIKRTGDRKTGTKTVRTDTAYFLKPFFGTKQRAATTKIGFSSVVNNKQQETKVRRTKEQRMAEKTHVRTVQQKMAILEKLPRRYLEGIKSST
jgi:hypothetical protein